MIPEWIPQTFFELLPSTTAMSVFIVCYFLYGWFSKRRIQAGKQSRISTQLVFVFISLVGLAVFILTLPINEALKGQLFSLIGIILSAALALSSTTFIGNAMAGVMLTTTNSFKMGDFIKVGDYAGRISDRGLLHVEIQSEDRNLTILPNLYLVTNPYRIIHSKGTIISVDVSLGYDTDRNLIEDCLLKAATDAGLESAFMQIVKLGDFSVSYRVSGVLKEVKQRITAQTELYKSVMDSLHKHHIEIVSPTYMNTRSQTAANIAIPKTTKPAQENNPLMPIESIVFDKAENAETKDTLKHKLKKIDEARERLTQLSKADLDEKSKLKLTQRISNLDELEKKIHALILNIEKEDKPTE